MATKRTAGDSETFVTKKTYIPDIITRVNGVTQAYNITPFPWIRDKSENGPLFTIVKNIKDLGESEFGEGFKRVVKDTSKDT